MADVAQRDPATCRLDEPLGDVRGRLRRGDDAPVVVLDTNRVVLGVVEPEALKGDPAVSIEQVMRPDPVSFRPNVRIGETPQYFKQHKVRHTLVTTSDGVLVGLLRLEQTVGTGASTVSKD